MSSSGSPPSVCPSLLKCSHLEVHKTLLYTTAKSSAALFISSSLWKCVLKEQHPQEQKAPLISVWNSQEQTENVVISDLLKNPELKNQAFKGWLSFPFSVILESMKWGGNYTISVCINQKCLFKKKKCFVSSNIYRVPPHHRRRQAGVSWQIYN